MSLFLLEIPTTSAHQREDVQPVFRAVARAVEQDGGEFIEAQVPSDLQRAYVIVEHADEARLKAALRAQGTLVSGVSQVRLVGANLDDVKAARRHGKAEGKADYLVEWDFPAGLSMDAYLTRKKEKAPLYAQVPEVRFLRTYVCEDMTKCLCFYQAQDEAAVRRAREVVSTPITRLSRLEESAAPEPAGASGAAGGARG
jgi:hypothetical protein